MGQLTNPVVLSSPGVIGVLPPGKGGTGVGAYSVGDTLYASAVNTLSKLAGNTDAIKKFQTQIGDGSASAAPQWLALTSLDITTALGFVPGSGSGTVTSVTVTGALGSGIGASGSPITGSGTITLSLGNIVPTSVNSSGLVGGASLATSNIKISSNQIFEYATNGATEIDINLVGYNGGVSQFRDTVIGDGKGGVVARFSGAASALQLGAPLASAYGGTGNSTYVDGQLNIGNTSTGGLSKSTISSGTGVTIANGNGTIAISIGQAVAPANSPTFAGGTLTLSGANQLLLNGVTSSAACSIQSNVTSNAASIKYVNLSGNLNNTSGSPSDSAYLSINPTLQSTNTLPIARFLYINQGSGSGSAYTEVNALEIEAPSIGATTSRSILAKGVCAFSGTASGSALFGTTIAATTTLMTIGGSTQAQAKITLTGQEFYQAAHTSTDGIALLAGVNRSGNRQLWLADSAALTQNSTNTALQFGLGASVGVFINSTATDGTTALPLSIQSVGGFLGIGSSSAPLFGMDVRNTGVNTPIASFGKWTGNGGAPTALGFPYLKIGGNEFSAGGYYTIGFAYQTASIDKPAIEIGAITTVGSGARGIYDFIIATSTANSLSTAAVESVRVSSDGFLSISQVGKTLKIKQGSNSCFGVGATLVGGAITVNTTAISTGDLVLVSRTAVGGTIGVGMPTVTISNGVSFTLTSSNALDTSTYSWLIIKAA